MVILASCIKRLAGRRAQRVTPSVFGLVALFGCFILCSCALKQTNTLPQDTGSGSITLSRAIPAVQQSKGFASQTALGFVPPLAATTAAGRWLSIDVGHRKIALMEGDRILDSADVEQLGPVERGNYQLLHKQRNPLWYAPNSYFSRRRLTVPPQGDRSRYRRGALGDFALFIDKDTPIHSAPIWAEDVGGIRLKEESLSRIYYRLEIGSVIEVK